LISNVFVIQNPDLGKTLLPDGSFGPRFFARPARESTLHPLDSVLDIVMSASTVMRIGK
jgi:hypothetical protein